MYTCPVCKKVSSNKCKETSCLYSLQNYRQWIEESSGKEDTSAKCNTSLPESFDLIKQLSKLFRCEICQQISISKCSSNLCEEISALCEQYPNLNLL